MELVTSRNIEELVLILKKEIGKTQGVVEHEDTGKYRQLLVRTLHSTCIKFPDVASSVIPVLMEFLSDSNELAAMDVLIFVREAMNRFSNLRPIIVEKLLESFGAIRSVKIHRAALWILGEYCEKSEDMQTLMSEIRSVPGSPLLVMLFGALSRSYLNAYRILISYSLIVLHLGTGSKMEIIDKEKGYRKVVFYQ